MRLALRTLLATVFCAVGLIAAIFVANAQEATEPATEEPPEMPPEQAVEGQNEEAVAVAEPQEATADAEMPAGIERNPFWPVGWWPQKPQGTGDVVKGTGGGDDPKPRPEPEKRADWVEAEKVLMALKPEVFKGPNGTVARFGKQYAGVGEVISISSGKFMYTWKVVELKAGLKISRQNVRPVR